MDNTELNKAGDKRGCKDTNEHNFANDPELASVAGKKGNKGKKAAIQAITKSPVIASGRNKRITPEIQELIRDELTAVDKNGVPYVHQFIKAFLTEAKKDLNSAPAKMLANAMFKDDLLSTLDEELNKQMSKDYAFIEYRIRQTLYDKQKEVFDDNLSPTIECICTRRAGKSSLVARMLVREVIKPPYETPTGKLLPRNALYLNRTFDNAVTQMGKPVVELLDEFGIKYSGSPGSGRLNLDNGASITFGGFNNKGDIDKFRGNFYSLVSIDEISHLRNPDMLFRETLEPALKDYGHEGRTIMTGTPPRTKASFAYKMWHNDNIKHYHWSFMDNPYIPNKEEIIDAVCKEHGVTIDAPFIQREYFGNCEAIDVDSMIFRGYKTYKDLAQGAYDFAYIGVDWGFEDKAAVISAVVRGKKLYIIKSWSEAKKSISDICEEVKRQKEYLDSLQLAHRCMVICDTNEKSAILELYNTYKIKEAYCAYKYDKDMAIEQLAEWLRTDVIFVNEKCAELIEDLDNTIWARDDNDVIIHEIDDEEYHPNAAMALLYISRQFDYDVLGRPNAKTAKSILER